MRRTGRLGITKIVDATVERMEDELIREARVSLVLDGETILDTVCSPGQYDALAYGHLLSQGMIRAVEDVRTCEANEKEGTITVSLRSSSPMESPAFPLKNGMTIPFPVLQDAVQTLHEKSLLFHATGGTHTVAIGSVERIHTIAEDISRTCALEKALGEMLLDRIERGRCFIGLSSRVPRGFVLEIARAGIPIIAAVSAPTYEAVEEAERLGLCLCGFVRKGRLNVYSNPWRVGL